MTDHIRTATADGVFTLTLARPDKINALTDAMYGAMADAVAQAAADDAVRAILIEGEGDNFSAGNDLSDFMVQNAAGGDRGEPNVFRFMRALVALDKPLVAAVTGRAVGIGVTLLLHCDLVYVARDARLSAPFVDLAVVPEFASSILMPAVVGHTRAYCLFALGETIDGETAAAWGIATVALDAGEVASKARAAAQALSRKPPAALAATKRLLRDAERISTRLEVESRLFAERLVSEEAREAFTAFFERRPADFSRVAKKSSGAT